MKLRPRDSDRTGESVLELDSGPQVKCTVSLRRKRAGNRIVNREIVITINGGTPDDLFVEMAMELGVYIADTRSP